METDKMEKEITVLEKLRLNASLIVSLIAILAVISQAFTIPERVNKLESEIAGKMRVEKLEREVRSRDKRIQELERTIIDIHSRVKTIETQTRQLHDYFLEKGLESKHD